MIALNEHNSPEYKEAFLGAIEMIDTRSARGISHIQNDVEIMSMLLDVCEPYFEEGEEFSARFPYENMMLRMTWRRQGIINSRFMCDENIAKHNNACSVLAYDGWCDVGHTAPDWKNILSLGFVGLAKRLEEGLEREDITDKQREYFEYYYFPLLLSPHSDSRVNETVAYINNYTRS